MTRLVCLHAEIALRLVEQELPTAQRGVQPVHLDQLLVSALRRPTRASNMWRYIHHFGLIRAIQRRSDRSTQQQYFTAAV